MAPRTPSAKEQRPRNAPTRTIPINQVGLTRAQIHEIKEGIGAGAADWTGIAPVCEVITSDDVGLAVFHGPADDYTTAPTGLC